MEELVTQIEQALAEVERELSDPAVSSDLQRMAQLGRRHKELSEQAALGARWRAASQGIEDARGMLESEQDPEMRSYLEAELAGSEEALTAVEEELRLALVERDPNDGRDVIIELRPGAGGDEAALFTGDIYRMLTEYARAARLQDGAAHRDRQRSGRLPRGDVRGQGRRRLLGLQVGVGRAPRAARARDGVAGAHPHLDDDGRRAARGRGRRGADRAQGHQDRRHALDGPGGQSVNTTDSAVRITHLPTGIVVACQDERSQIQNRERALKILRARLYERALEERNAAEAAERLSQIGTGERSEKIRTYNYPERRVTDHRIKFTSHNLDAVLAGDLSAFTQALQDEDRSRRLEAASSA